MLHYDFFRGKIPNCFVQPPDPLFRPFASGLRVPLARIGAVVVR